MMTINTDKINCHNVPLEIIEKLEESGFTETIIHCYKYNGKNNYIKIVKFRVHNIAIDFYSEEYQKLSELDNENNK